MAAANKIADAEVSASNNEAISETGTSTPSIAPASSTPQLQLEALLQEVALLEQQLQAQQSSTQVIQNLQSQVQQQSQTLQQIASNTQSIASAQALAPTSNIQANGSTGSVVIPYGTTAFITWASNNTNSCNVSPLGSTATGGGETTGNLMSSQTYTIFCSGAGGSTSASVSVNVSSPPAGSTPISQNTDVAPSSITVMANQGLNPPTGQLAMGTTGDTLAAFNFQETANLESVVVSELDVVDVLTPSTMGAGTNTASVLPSFNNLTLWNSGKQLGGTANYIGPTTVNGQNAFLYQFQFGSANPFVIPRNGTFSVTLKGNVSTYASGDATDGSIHTFEITTSVPAPTATSTVVAFGVTSNQQPNVRIPGAVGTQQTVLRNNLILSAAELGTGGYRQKSTADQLATLTLTPNNAAAGVALNTITINFYGSAIPSSTAQEDAFASSTYLWLAGTQYPETSFACTANNGCNITWSFGSGISGLAVGNPATFTLVTDDLDNTMVAGGINNAVSLYVMIPSDSSIQYTDGTDSNSTTLSGVPLSASVITPLQIFNAQFAQGT